MTLIMVGNDDGFQLGLFMPISPEKDILTSSRWITGTAR